MDNVEVDGFEIDIETLYDATKGTWRGDLASLNITEQVIKNLTPESKRRFEEYQEQNNPCR